MIWLISEFVGVGRACSGAEKEIPKKAKDGPIILAIDKESFTQLSKRENKLAAAGGEKNHIAFKRQKTTQILRGGELYVSILIDPQLWLFGLLPSF